MVDNEILKEIAKNNFDKAICDKELERGKIDFINEISKYDMSIDNEPIKKKIPIGLRMRWTTGRFLNKIMNVLGHEQL